MFGRWAMVKKSPEASDSSTTVVAGSTVEDTGAAGDRWTWWKVGIVGAFAGGLLLATHRK